MKYLILIILWSIWCIVHSGMISDRVTGYLKIRLGTYYRFYRLFFNVTALITLSLVVRYAKGLENQVIFSWDGYWKPLQMLLLILAILLFVAGASKYDMLQFLGLRQIASGKTHATLSKNGEIDTSGILNITRHPWYLAALILIWTHFQKMYISTLLTCIVLSIYVIIGTILEERKLLVEHGDRYKAYMRRVSMLFPTKWIRAKSILLIGK